jgi:hypothetical protein
MPSIVPAGAALRPPFAEPHSSRCLAAWAIVVGTAAAEQVEDGHESGYTTCNDDNVRF